MVAKEYPKLSPTLKEESYTSIAISEYFPTFLQMEQFKHRTITNKFSVDFKNMPRGVKVAAPKSGDFDYSYGYVLDGGVWWNM